MNAATGGQLIKVESPLDPCFSGTDSPACQDVFRHLNNPYFLGDQVGLTQTTGWLDAWVSKPSAYAVAAKRTGDVVAAVIFARENDLRLVVKGGGHSYTGTSDSVDSLLIWTRHMNDVVLHDAFVGAGCGGQTSAVPAVSIGAGAIWMPVYETVMGGAGRYVQGGGCATVGVAGLVQSGGFGSFSKRYGTGAGGLLEAEIVTADGAVRVVNACQEPDLFWALKGGGGGVFGVVTRVTLKTHDLPDWVGGAFLTVKAKSDAACRTLIDRFLVFYRESLFNPHWGEEIHFHPDNRVEIGMVFQSLDPTQARAVWQPFLDWVAASPDDYVLASPAMILGLPARKFWDAEFLRTNLSRFYVADDRPGAPRGNLWSVGDGPEASRFMNGLASAWLPASLLDNDRRESLGHAVFVGSRHWTISLHVNKGLAGAPPDAVAGARDTAMNPAVLDAFALAIVGAALPMTIPDVRGHEPDLTIARAQAANVAKAIAVLADLVPDAGSYVSESDYFQQDWQRSHWGGHYARLASVKQKYDPTGLFFAHHGVGSEAWSEDGFTRLQGG